jgi:hypothetical protein
LAKIFGNILDALQNQIKDAPNSTRHKKRIGTGQLPQKHKGPWYRQIAFEIWSDVKENEKGTKGGKGVALVRRLLCGAG